MKMDIEPPKEVADAAEDKKPALVKEMAASSEPEAPKTPDHSVYEDAAEYINLHSNESPLTEIPELKRASENEIQMKEEKEEMEQKEKKERKKKNGEKKKETQLSRRKTKRVGKKRKTSEYISDSNDDREPYSASSDSLEQSAGRDGDAKEGMSREERKFQALLRRIENMENKESGKRKRKEKDIDSRTPRKYERKVKPVPKPKSGSPAAVGATKVGIAYPPASPTGHPAAAGGMRVMVDDIDMRVEIEKRKRIIEELESNSDISTPSVSPPLSPKLIGKKKWATQFTEKHI